MTSTRSMSSYKSSNQSIHQKKNQTLKTRSNNIWNHFSNPINIKAKSVYPITYRAYAHNFIHCYSIRTIARKIERMRLIELAYFNKDLKTPSLREMVHMTHINIVQNK